MNVAAATIPSQDTTITDSATRTAEIYLLRFAALTPLLWFAGLLTPAAVMLIAVLLLRAPVKVWIGDLVIWTWIAVGLVQFTSTIVNCIDIDQGVGCIAKRGLSMTVLGWVFIGLLFAIGRSYRVSVGALSRVACILGSYCLFLAGITLFSYYILGIAGLEFRTPPSLLLNLPAETAQFHFEAKIYGVDYEAFGGRLALPRMTLFYPWPVALSFACIPMFFLALQERSRTWRLAGSLGAIFGLVLAFSRAGILIFLVCAAMYFLMTARYKTRILIAPAVAFLFVGGLFLLFAPEFGGGIGGILDYVDSLRAGSSQARSLVVAATQAAIPDALLLGHGWVGEILSPNIRIPLGSHSTVWGVLYTGGIITFLLFVTAALMTVGSIALAYLRSPDAFRAAALVVVLGFFAFSLTEGLYSFVVPAAIFFIWIGRARRQVRASALQS